jgi:hypothetical protein
VNERTTDVPSADAASNMAVVADLEPRALWQRFAALTAIARPSRGEELAAAHVEEWAAVHLFPVVADDVGNLRPEPRRSASAFSTTRSSSRCRSRGSRPRSPAS